LFGGVPNVRVIVVLLGVPGLLHAHLSDIAASRITTRATTRVAVRADGHSALSAGVWLIQISPVATSPAPVAAALKAKMRLEIADSSICRLIVTPAKRVRESTLRRLRGRVVGASSGERKLDHSTRPPRDLGDAGARALVMGAQGFVVAGVASSLEPDAALTSVSVDLTRREPDADREPLWSKVAQIRCQPSPSARRRARSP
jgi:hypothetical protein